MSKEKANKLPEEHSNQSSGFLIPADAFASNEQIFSPEILRSNLFNAKKSGPRESYNNKEISTIGDCTINYTGDELRVSDLEVIKYVIALLKGRPISSNDPNGLYVRFTRYEACLSIFNSAGGNEYKKLNESLERMARKSALTFHYEKEEGKTFKLDGVSLIRKFGVADDKNVRKGMLEAYLEPEIVKLLGFEHSILPLNTENLSPQAVKIRDYLITRTNPYEKITLTQLRDVIWGSSATDKSIRNQLSRVSKALVKTEYLRSNIRVNKYGELEFDVGPRIDANRSSDPNQFILDL